MLLYILQNIKLNVQTASHATSIAAASLKANFIDALSALLPSANNDSRAHCIWRPCECNADVPALEAIGIIQPRLICSNGFQSHKKFACHMI